MIDPTLSRSEIFTWFNKARRAASAGLLEIGRLNRALGLLLNGDDPRPYDTTEDACSCLDWIGTGYHRGGRYFDPVRPCKHMIAVRGRNAILRERFYS